MIISENDKLIDGRRCGKTETLKKAMQDMIIYGTGAILVNGDEVKYIEPGQIHIEVKDDNQ